MVQLELSWYLLFSFWLISICSVTAKPSPFESVWNQYQPYRVASSDFDHRSRSFCTQSFETMNNNDRVLICTNSTSFSLLEFENCKYCWKMIFKYGNISVIPTNTYGGATNLMELQMSNIGIEKIETGAFSHLPNLKILNLASNSLKKLSRGSFNSLHNLEYLNFSHNIISEVEEETFHGSISIKYLDMSFNEITYLPENIFPLPELVALNISHNRLATIGDDFCDEKYLLSTVVLNNNFLTEIPSCLAFSSVSHLFLSYNNISVLNSFNLPSKLEEFSVGSNKLMAIPEKTFPSSVILKSLDLSNNSLAGISSEYFRNLENLEQLDISASNISTINPILFKFTKYLSVLRMTNNNLTSFQKGVFQYLSHLNFLDISGNKIDFLQLGVFTDLVSVEYLNISHNNIHYLKSGTMNGMKMLKFLDLSFNKIRFLTFHLFSTLKNLSILNLKSNQIASLNIGYTIRRNNILYIDLDNNDFNCGILAEIIFQLQSINIQLISGKTISSENIDGVSCHEMIGIETTTNSKEEKSKLELFLQKDFEDTAFYNFFKKFNSRNLNNIDKLDLNERIRSQTNLTHAFEKSINVHIEEFMKFENASFLNFLKELVLIVRRLEDNRTHNDSSSLENLFLTFRNEIKTFVSYENASFVKFMNHLSDIVDRLIENRNHSEYIPEIMHANNAAMLYSKDTKGTTELIDAIIQLKLFIVLYTFFALLLILVMKIFPYVKKKYLKTDCTEVHNLEMPFLS